MYYRYTHWRVATGSRKKERNEYQLNICTELKQFGFINKEIQKAFLRNRKSIYISKWSVTPDDYDLAVQELMAEFEDYRGFTRFNCWTAKKI
ncbi:unnamed protein product [Rhizopus microsporus]